MNEQFKELINTILSEEKYNYFVENYEQIKNMKMITIGIDSLEYISLLSELDDIYGFSAEDIDKIETLSDVETLISRR